MEKPVAGSLCPINVHGKCFSLKARIEKFLELIEISWLQVMKNKLTQICQLCVSTIVKVSVMKNISWCGCCSLLIFVAKKAGKGTEVQFLCTEGTLQGGRVEDHKLMFTRHLHPPQLYIQAILYIYKTDYIMSLTLYTLTPACIFSMLFFIHFLHLLAIIVKIVWKANR